MYDALQHIHSGFRWIVLLILLIGIFQSYRGWKSGSPWSDSDRRRNLFVLIAIHIQVLLGIILYFISPAVSFGEGVMSNPISRFYTIEHSFLMIIAAIICTLGYSRAKRESVPQRKFRTSFYLFLATLLIILAAIPWPFRGLGGGWY
jgi:hypothetical protein